MPSRPRYPHARAYTDARGKRRWRFRPKGGRGFTRELGTAYGSDDFRERYAAAEAEWQGKTRAGAGADRTRPGTLADLIAAYLTSPEWLGLASSTRRSYRTHLDYLRERYGNLPVAGLRRGHVADILAKRHDKPGAANNLRKRFAQLIDFAVARDWIATNPVRQTKPYKMTGDGFHAWDEGEIARFFEVHPPGTAAHRAVTLMLCTGAARVDAVRLGPWNIKGGRIEYRRQKTARSGGVMVSIPIHPDLAAVLDGLPDDRPFLATAYGKPRTASGLGNAMREWCDKARLSACSSHGLRKACARRLAEAGATAHEIMAITGHKTLAEVQRYTAAAQREALADSAHQKLLARPKQEQTVVNMPGRFTTKTPEHHGKKGKSNGV